MDPKQIEMLRFLMGTTALSPKDLETEFDLRADRTTYNLYMQLVRERALDSNRNGFWLTPQGEQILSEERQ